jgi:glycosyltransferase involved in cell wall biosynthesis
MVLGLRGFPGIQGGVESHAEHLYSRLAGLGCDVEAVVRSAYWPADRPDSWRNIRFRCLWSPKTKGLEALVHTFLGVLYAGVKRPDILHIHAIGPAIVTPLARLLGLRVVVTHHGPDYDREKWGKFARWILRAGENLGMRFANRRIVISNVIRELVRTKYDRDSVLIRNGVIVSEMPQTSAALKQFSLKPGRYILNVSRFVPEKRHLDLVQAYAQAALPNWKLVLVGAVDPPDDYIRSVRDIAARTPGVVIAGFQSGQTLQELYGHAGMFVLPSSHEGLPIVLLEALSFGLPAIASDIPANLEIGLPENQYFELGEISALARLLRETTSVEPDSQTRERIRTWVRERYDWDKIAEETLNVYNSVYRQSS